MSTNPIPPVPPTGPGSDPDENPDLVDPVGTPDISGRPGDDSPLSQPAPNPDEDPNEQLPRE
ncbi:hypothetical protein FB561_2371 [Kribbella amoyensis]|uniref:Uncharacterized protein n=1 Tax=Kribbella amoyensis TaxID=996641 RepID=A0A561BQV4_9ACTN|nr:hypothetical protein [Kribbella amoyensis]TWD81260.1 hypothetical protein FB561_2371 [Kribbella amoyensis]